MAEAEEPSCSESGAEWFQVKRDVEDVAGFPDWTGIKLFELESERIFSTDRNVKNGKNR